MGLPWQLARFTLVCNCTSQFLRRSYLGFDSRFGTRRFLQYRRNSQSDT